MGHLARKPKPTIECDKLWKAYDEELIQSNKQKYFNTTMNKQPLSSTNQGTTEVVSNVVATTPP